MNFIAKSLKPGLRPASQPDHVDILSATTAQETADADILAAFEREFAALISQPWPELPSDGDEALLDLARARYGRRALEAALDHGMALLEALGLPPVSPAIDRAIRALDALDSPGEDMEDGDDAEQDRADEELSLGWTTSVSQVDLGDNADDAEPYLSAVEFDGRGDNWRRSGNATCGWGTDVEGVNEDGSGDGREELGWFLQELDVPLVRRGMIEDARRVGAGAHA